MARLPINGWWKSAGRRFALEVKAAVVRRAARNNFIGQIEDVAGHYQDIGRKYLDALSEVIKRGRHVAEKAPWIVRRSRQIATQMDVRKMQEPRHWTEIAGLRVSEHFPFNDADGGEFLDTDSYPSGLIEGSLRVIRSGFKLRWIRFASWP